MIVEAFAIDLAVIRRIPDADCQFPGRAGLIQPEAQKRHGRKFWIDRIDLDRRADLMDALFGRPGEKLHTVMHGALLHRGWVKSQSTDGTGDPTGKQKRLATTGVVCLHMEPSTI